MDFSNKLNTDGVCYLQSQLFPYCATLATKGKILFFACTKKYGN